VGQVGELCFRSPQVAQCYWNDPSATATSFVNAGFTQGSRYYDPEGYVYVVDRLKDVVIRGGENVYCAEVEAVLFEHPRSLMCVIGLPESAMGRGLRSGCASCRDGSRPRRDQAFGAKHLAGFKCPEALYIADELPRTATGKTAKAELRAR